MTPHRSVDRLAAHILKRLKTETVLRPLGPVCYQEWCEARDIIAEEIARYICPTCQGTGRTDGALGFAGQGPCPTCSLSSHLPA